MTTDDAGGGDEGERLSPDRAFSLLGDPTRLAVVRTLWEADSPLPFSDLRERVEVRDSGQFNYHLGRLVGSYVHRGEAGYELTPAGEYLMSAILAGATDQRPQLGTFPIDGTCFHCGGGLEGEFEELGVVRCADCGRTVMTDAFPPAGGIDRTPDEIARAFDRWVRHRLVLASEGVCPQCAGPVDTHVHLDAGDSPSVRGEHVCRNCKHEEGAPVVFYVLDHPAVVSLYHEHGVDLRELPYWEFRYYLAEYTTEVVSEDPLRVRVTVPVEDDRLRLTLDGGLDVVEVESEGG